MQSTVIYRYIAVDISLRFTNKTVWNLIKFVAAWNTETLKISSNRYYRVTFQLSSIIVTLICHLYKCDEKWVSVDLINWLISSTDFDGCGIGAPKRDTNMANVYCVL